MIHDSCLETDRTRNMIFTTFVHFKQINKSQHKYLFSFFTTDEKHFSVSPSCFDWNTRREVKCKYQVQSWEQQLSELVVMQGEGWVDHNIVCQWSQHSSVRMITCDAYQWWRPVETWAQSCDCDQWPVLCSAPVESFYNMSNTDLYHQYDRTLVMFHTKIWLN